MKEIKISQEHLEHCLQAFSDSALPMNGLLILLLLQRIMMVII